MGQGCMLATIALPPLPVKLAMGGILSRSERENPV
jgi:hypothetical protein